ncbi:TPA: hypothetical protein R1720_000358, partial [Campylobacter lari]|nr:hypothetical protein [Campylobacter lari]
LRDFLLKIWNEELNKKIKKYEEKSLKHYNKQVCILMEKIEKENILGSENCEGNKAISVSKNDFFETNANNIENILENFKLEFIKDFHDKNPYYGNNTGCEKKLSIKSIIDYFEIIKNNHALKEICDLLGKSRNDDNKEGKNDSNLNNNAQKTSKESKEEIKGVILGRNLEELLAQELGLLNDEDLENLFVLKYLENRLFCFEKQGYINKMQNHKNKGAIIICVDSSGSMDGQPEIIAKGITYYMVKKALKEKSACYLINFSTKTKCEEIDLSKGMKKLFDFLCFSFNGGTDVSIALKEGVKKMQEDGFERSDLLVISDGFFGDIDNKILKQMEKQREQENKFYLLDINGCDKVKTIFDKHWKYDTSTKIITTLYDIKNTNII